MSRYDDQPTLIRGQSKKKGRKPRIGIEIDPGGFNQYLSTHETFITDGNTYDGLIANGGAPVINRSIPRLGGLGTISEMMFSVLNQNLFSSIFASYPNPKGLSVDAYLYFDDGTALLDAERTQIFSGEISEFPDISYETVDFKAKSKDFRTNAQIGVFVTDPGEEIDQPLPEESKGKMEPIIIGDHVGHYGSADIDVTTADPSNNFVPAIYLGVKGGEHYWFVAGHKVDDVTAMWGWDASLGRMVELKSTITVVRNSDTPGADGCIIKHQNTPEYYDYYYGDGTVSNNASTGGVDWADHGQGNNRIDDDYTVGIMTTADSQGLGDSIREDADFSDYTASEILDTLDAVDVRTKVEYIPGSSLPDGNIAFQVNATVMETSLTSGVPAVLSAGTNAATVAGVNTNITMSVTKDLTGANTELECRVYEIWKRVTYTAKTGTPLPLYFGGIGLEYSTDINSRTEGDEDR